MSKSRDSEPLRSLIGEGAQRLQCSLRTQAEAQLVTYVDELVRWNAAYNLTAVRDPRAMVTRHLLDSLAILPYVDARASLLDVGAGPGVPGLVLAIAEPALAVTVLDSNGKKVRFMRHAVRTLGLHNAQVVEARVERFAPPEPYAQIVSRAFASLSDFVTLSRELLVPGGRWLAMKGQLLADEQRALPGFAVIEAAHALAVPGLDEQRHLVVMRDVERPLAG